MEVCLGQIAVELNRLTVLTDGVLDLAQIVICPAPSLVNMGHPGLTLEGLVVILDRLFQVAGRVVSLSTVQVSVGQLRVQPERFTEVFDGRCSWLSSR